MLKGVDPLLGPDLLAALYAMGHGDMLAIVDANYPALASARRLVRADGIDAVRMLRAVVSVLPIDDFVAPAAWRMAVVGAPDETPSIVADFERVLGGAGYVAGIGTLEREEFYARSRDAFAIVATGETRLYGNLILVKGVVPHAD